MVKRKRQCWFCLEVFIAKNRRAKFCCGSHRVKYWRWKHKQ